MDFEKILNFVIDNKEYFMIGAAAFVLGAWIF